MSISSFSTLFQNIREPTAPDVIRELSKLLERNDEWTTDPKDIERRQRHLQAARCIQAPCFTQHSAPCFRQIF